MDKPDLQRRNHWVNHIARHAHAKPDEVYLRFEGRSVTWAQLHERVNAVAAAMAARGVGFGDRVAIMMTNRPEFLEVMFAASVLGAIAVPVNFRLTPDEVAYILTDSGATLLVVEEATGETAAGPAASAQSVRPGPRARTPGSPTRRLRPIRPGWTCRRTARP